jgi:hypothetical protein
MPEYRCYPLNFANSIDGPAQDLECIDDASAIENAYAVFPERAFEVWRGTRRVYVRKARSIGT